MTFVLNVIPCYVLSASFISFSSSIVDITTLDPSTSFKDAPAFYIFLEVFLSDSALVPLFPDLLFFRD